MPNDPIQGARGSDASERALAEALAEAGLPEDFAETVLDLAEQPESEWPLCCDSDCDPCVMTLCRVACRYRTRILHGPGSPSTPAPSTPAPSTKKREEDPGPGAQSS